MSIQLTENEGEGMNDGMRDERKQEAVRNVTIGCHLEQ